MNPTEILACIIFAAIAGSIICLLADDYTNP